MSLIGAAITWTISQVKDRTQKAEELCWRRTEFIFRQGELLDTDPGISNGVKLLAGDLTAEELAKLLDTESQAKSSEDTDKLHDIEKLMNLLERLSIAFEQEVVTDIELKHFEWYFWKVVDDDVVRAYCRSYFPNVLKVANSLGLPKSRANGDRNAGEGE